MSEFTKQNSAKHCNMFGSEAQKYAVSTKTSPFLSVQALFSLVVCWTVGAVRRANLLLHSEKYAIEPSFMAELSIIIIINYCIFYSVTVVFITNDNEISTKVA